MTADGSKRIRLKCGKYKNQVYPLTFIQQDHYDAERKVWLHAKANRTDIAALNFVRFYRADYMKLHDFLVRKTTRASKLPIMDDDDDDSC